MDLKCLLIIDELQAIAPKRGNDTTNENTFDRLLSCLLTEMDGIKYKTNHIDMVKKHVKTRANAALGPLGAQNGLLRPARVPPVRSKGLFEPASAPLVRSRWPLWPAPEPPVRSERLIELAWAPPVRSKWPVWHAPVLVSVLKEAVRACFGAASALKEAFRACCSRSLFAKAGLGCTVL